MLAVGALVAVQPLAAAASVGAGALVLLAAKHQVALAVTMTLIWGLLAAYLFMGRGFAYLGVPPVYAGEAVLMVGLVGLIVSRGQHPLTAMHIVLGAFMLWGAARTIPFIATYGLDAFRDAVTWGYAAFAIVISRLVRLLDVERLIGWYGRLVPIVVVWVPVIGVAWLAARASFPMVPGTDVQVPYFKAGDFAVHLAGAGAFVLVGLYPRTHLRRLTEPLLWAAWLVGFSVLSALNRGGMLAMLAATSTVLIFVRSFARWLAVLLTGLLLLSVVAAANLEVDVGRDRDLSLGQVIQNLTSVVGDTGDPGLAGTREWREQWWSEIVGYTFSGQYFWDGKGYGVNLAEADGFLGVQFPELRAPHNAHVQFLARSGVPGFALWVTTQLAFAGTMLLSAQRCARSGRRRWLALHAWILAYWIAAIVNMTFDVYLEGPQGGIVFWSLIGLGLGVVALARETDRDLDQPADTVELPRA